MLDSNKRLMDKNLQLKSGESECPRQCDSTDQAANSTLIRQERPQKCFRLMTSSCFSPVILDFQSNTELLFPLKEHFELKNESASASLSLKACVAVNGPHLCTRCFLSFVDQLKHFLSHTPSYNTLLICRDVHTSSTGSVQYLVSTQNQTPADQRFSGVQRLAQEYVNTWTARPGWSLIRFDVVR